MTDATVTEVDEFVATFLPRQVEAERALHDGDLAPRLELWSRADPVTLFGAWGPCDSGWTAIGRTFDWVASRFSDCAAYELA